MCTKKKVPAKRWWDSRLQLHFWERRGQGLVCCQKQKQKQAAHSLRRHYPGQVQRDFLSLHLSFRMNRAPEAERQKGKHPWCWLLISLKIQKYMTTSSYFFLFLHIRETNIFLLIADNGNCNSVF